LLAWVPISAVGGLLIIQPPCLRLGILVLRAQRVRQARLSCWRFSENRELNSLT
jgi:hypothetical protein